MSWLVLLSTPVGWLPVGAFGGACTGAAGLSAGPIIGIVIAVLVVAALVAFGATVFARTMKHGARRNQSFRNGAGVVGDVML